PFVTGAFESSISKTDGVLGVLRFGFLDDSLDIDTLFKAQEQEINAQLLASPRILTLDNETALIQIIRQIPYQEITETSAGGQIGSTEFRDVGVMLEVTPHVTRDGYVRMHIRPEFSVVSGSVLVNGLVRSNPQPVVDSRSADTVTLIKTGETVVIGGLKKKEVSQMVDKIPLLGDIPLLGYFFRFEGEEEIDSELLVFITPYIVDDPMLTKEEKAGLDATRLEMPPVTPLLRSQQRCGIRNEMYPELESSERNKDRNENNDLN
ncbi:MAG: type II and III secretion system protein, partial [Deltaproteobacteria bacterium]|nr:type II and III secretion system protein [Deltaproteobacteria bacterium]